MTALKTTPTKSNLLDLRRQLGFALEGFELLDQKRQILALELVRWAERLGQAEHEVAEGLRRAHLALREASLDSGSAALDRVALGVEPGHQVSRTEQRLMGISLPSVRVQLPAPPAFLGLRGTSPAADLAQGRFAEVLTALGSLAEAQGAVLRIGRELKRAQRRCNALTKMVIPDHRKAIRYVAGALEEREREAFMDRKLRSRRRAGS